MLEFHFGSGYQSPTRKKKPVPILGTDIKAALASLWLSLNSNMGLCQGVYNTSIQTVLGIGFISIDNIFSRVIHLLLIQLS